MDTHVFGDWAVGGRFCTQAIYQEIQAGGGHVEKFVQNWATC